MLQPPINELRWRPPQPTDSWDEPIFTQNVHSLCYFVRNTRNIVKYALNNFKSAGETTLERYKELEENGIFSENCLKLDIRRPIRRHDDKLPI